MNASILFLVAFFFLSTLSVQSPPGFQMNNSEGGSDIEPVTEDPPLSTLSYHSLAIINPENEMALDKEEEEEEGKRAEFGSSEFWFYVGAAAVLTMIAGLMSGLTVGYLSIDELVLELKKKNGTEEEKKQAKNIRRILKDHHWLLVTLLVANAGAMEALPICLNMLVPEYLAIILSVTAVLIFGEVLPQAICTGPNQIAIAAALAPCTKFLMMMEAPISYTISLLLDLCLGKHTKNRYKNTDLKALIELHTQNAVHEMEQEERKGAMGLSQEQSKLITGAIDLTTYIAKDAMKPYAEVETIDCQQPLTKSFLNRLTEQGYSRYPVYKDSKHNVIGILLVKKLLGLNKFDISLERLNIPLRMPLIVHPEMRLTDLLMEFQKGKSHIALVTKQTSELKRKMGLDSLDSAEAMRFDEAMAADPVEIMGIVTLEDVVEKVIGDPILDEDDYDKEHVAYLHPVMTGRRAEMAREFGRNMECAPSGTNLKKQLCDDLINKKGGALYDFGMRIGWT
eukprot:TRINITY_DN9124_c0_g1_i5.p1 TRINITY_DN9124_c0_g1~~TRINITY_DN9124_c0_g1_i5.p1  ORF type:complete len:509 (+),score=140.79 TRINITY_DN9124_c0_g1_i5:150-1676(+)